MWHLQCYLKDAILLHSKRWRFSFYHESSEGPVVRIQQHTGHRTHLSGAVPTVWTVNQDTDALLCNSLHTHTNTHTNTQSVQCHSTTAVKVQILALIRARIVARKFHYLVWMWIYYGKQCHFQYIFLKLAMFGKLGKSPWWRPCAQVFSHYF